MGQQRYACLFGKQTNRQCDCFGSFLGSRPCRRCQRNPSRLPRPSILRASWRDSVSLLPKPFNRKMLGRLWNVLPKSRSQTARLVDPQARMRSLPSTMCGPAQRRPKKRPLSPSGWEGLAPVSDKAKPQIHA